MTVDELRTTCDKAKQSPNGDCVILLVPGRWGDNKTKRLAGKGSPLGTIVSDAFDGHRGIWVSFSATEILAWLDKRQAKSKEVQP